MSYLFIPRLLGILVICYTFLLSIRILLSWFSQSIDRKTFAAICRFTDPYLDLFRGIRFLKTATFDYSPVFAIGILIIFSNVLLAIADSGHISLATVLLILLSTVASSLFWIIIFLLMLALIRYIFIVLGKDRGQPVWLYLDAILHVILIPVLKLYRHKPAYPKLLMTAILLLALLLCGGYLLVNLLARLIILIPF